MAQTTRFTSFGPVLPVVTSCKSLRNSIIPIELVDMISIEKKTRLKKKKTRTNCPNDAERVVWACSPRRSLILA